MKRADESTPRIAIVTALVHEFKAVRAILDDAREIDSGERGAGRSYVFGSIPSVRGRHTVVAVLLPDIGNNIAGIGATLLSTHFPSLECIFMTGIAGGVPDPVRPAEHVRLGDIVVSNREGVVQYDAGKSLGDRFVPRHPPRPPSARMLQVARMLLATDFRYTLDELIATGLKICGFRRPGEHMDILSCPTDPTRCIPHPADPDRIPGEPRIFLGPIASANQVLKDPVRRTQLQDEYRVKAVEMEGSGIADAAWTSSIEYFVVRGICDYCDSRKGDEWQPYAAVAAAAFTRLLISKVAARRDRPRILAFAATAALPATVLAIWGLAAAPSREPAGHLYIQAAQTPLEVQIDGRLTDSLTAAAPFTSLDLPPGIHWVLATAGNFRHMQPIRVRPGETAVVDIPSR